MKRSLKVVLGIVITAGAILTATPASSRVNSVPAQPLFEACPSHLIAPYGGTDGWSTIQVQANFARAIVTPAKKMVCQYRFGSGPIFFGIEKPCPAGMRCIAVAKGFRVLPAILKGRI